MKPESKQFTPLKVEDFGLSPQEMKELVTGAQRHLAPATEEQDEETFVPKVDPT